MSRHMNRVIQDTQSPLKKEALSRIETMTADILAEHSKSFLCIPPSYWVFLSANTFKSLKSVNLKNFHQIASEMKYFKDLLIILLYTARTIVSITMETSNTHFRKSVRLPFQLRKLRLVGPHFVNLSTIFSLKYLVLLELENIDLRGFNISQFWNMEKLISLVVISCFLKGPITNNIARLKNLKKLNLSGNFNIDGPIPPELCTLKNLEYVNFNNTGLTGQIPEYIGYLTNLKYFAAEQNHLTGKLPVDFSLCLCLEELRLCGNSLEGAIPDEIFKMSHLKYLCVTANPLGHLYDEAYREK
ncbi:hypothetical protein HK100_004830, partial [Physocladia obscura]